MISSEQPKMPADLHTVISNAPLIIWSADMNGVITMSEGKGLKEVGLKPGQLVGQSVFQLYKDNPQALQHLRRALDGETFVEEITISDRVFETHYSPLINSSGAVTGVVGTSTDITKRWEVDQLQAYLLKLADALRTETNLRQIKTKAMSVLGNHLSAERAYYAEVTDDGEHCIIDNSFHSGEGSIDGRYRLADFGRTRVAALRAGEMTVVTDVAKDLMVTLDERQMNLKMGIHAYINVPLVKQNKLICLLGVNDKKPRAWTSLETILVNETAERTWAAVERARADQIIQQSERHFKEIIEAIPQLVWVCNSAGEVIYLNQRWYDFTKADRGENLGHDWISMLHPDDVAPTIEKWQQAQQTATPLITEYRLSNGPGTYRWILSHGIPILNSNGTVERWFGTCTDIHDSKNTAQYLEEKVMERTAELKESNRLLERSNEDLKQFAYVSSHDLQEPLRKIQTFSSMALEQISETEMVRIYLSKIDSSAARMTALIRDLLQFSQANEGLRNFGLVDLNEIFEQVKIDFELLISEKKATIHVDALPRVIANALQIRQLFTNLLSNSLKFSAADPQIVIRYRLIRGSQVSELPGCDPRKSYHYLAFTDNGIGFEQDHARQIFMLFARLHNRNQYTGTGIGLALCKKIIENHHGMIHATSRAGHGSTFHLYLPAAAT